ncbi:hypothetical protein J2X72_003100 [Phyllobacterium sp. 1468]|nr:hypothetical protein [Phyllobacterium sp. 1468]
MRGNLSLVGRIIAGVWAQRAKQVSLNAPKPGFAESAR